jgi:hypothetical protein
VISQSFGATEQTFPNAQSLLNLRSAFWNAFVHGVTRARLLRGYGRNRLPAESQRPVSVPRDELAVVGPARDLDRPNDRSPSMMADQLPDIDAAGLVPALAFSH